MMEPKPYSSPRSLQLCQRLWTLFQQQVPENDLCILFLICTIVCWVLSVFFRPALKLRWVRVTLMTYSIFMAIMTISGSPAATAAPSSTITLKFSWISKTRFERKTFSITPGMGATASPAPPVLPPWSWYLGTGFENSTLPSLGKRKISFITCYNVQMNKSRIAVCESYQKNTLCKEWFPHW